MRTIINRSMLLLTLLFLVGPDVAAEPPVFPVKVGANGRYIVDQKGDPVFWLESIIQSVGDGSPSTLPRKLCSLLMAAP